MEERRGLRVEEWRGMTGGREEGDDGWRRGGGGEGCMEERTL